MRTRWNITIFFTGKFTINDEILDNSWFSGSKMMSSSEFPVCQCYNVWERRGRTCYGWDRPRVGTPVVLALEKILFHPEGFAWTALAAYGFNIYIYISISVYTYIYIYTFEHYFEFRLLTNDHISYPAWNMCNPPTKPWLMEWILENLGTYGYQMLPAITSLFVAKVPEK